MKLIGFSRHFATEEDCEKRLKEVREKEGIICSRCGCRKHYWNKANKSWICAECKRQTTLTSGTVMHGSNLPLMYWFVAMYLLISTNMTISASELQRQLGHKRYQPIWEMLHKLRNVMGCDYIYKLVGTIEHDEGCFSVENPLKEEETLNPKKGQKSKKFKNKVLGITKC